jgi:hypothetical protein
MKFLDFKREILSAIFGALFTAVLSLAIGLYSLNRSFELTQKKDLLYNLKTDIILLKNVERELDENLNLFLNHNYQILLEAEEIPFLSFPVEDGEDEEFSKVLEDYFEQLFGKMFKVTKFEYPPNKFIVDSWQPSGPTFSYIDFELIQLLNDLYRKLNRINDFLDNIYSISQGMTLPYSDFYTITAVSLPQFNKTVNEITQKSILNLKNRISQELVKLQKEYQDIEF